VALVVLSPFAVNFPRYFPLAENFGRPYDPYMELEPSIPGHFRLKPDFRLSVRQAIDDRKSQGREFSAHHLESVYARLGYKGDDLAFSINAYGFKGPPLDKSGRRPRILTVGDSCTFGSILDRYSYPRSLERSLQRLKKDVEVINAGVEGYAVRHVEREIERFIRLKPDLVTIYIGWNDLYYGQIPVDPGAKRVESWVHEFFRIQYETLVRLIVGQKRFALWQLYKNREPERDSQMVRDLANYSPPVLRNVEALVKKFKSQRIKVALVTLPGLYVMDQTPTSHALSIGHLPLFTNNPFVLAKLTERYNEGLRSMASRLEANLIDLDGWSRKAIVPRSGGFTDGIHLTEEYQQKAGEFFAAEIESGGMLNSPERRIASSIATRIGAGGTVYVDGKPFFPLGLYSSGSAPPRGFSLAEIAGAGFNLVTTHADPAALDDLMRHGLKAIVYLGPSLDSGEPGLAKVRTAVEKLRHHPAMLVWESINEPSWTYRDYTKNRFSAEGLTRGHEYLKSLDPAHLLLATHAPHQLIKTITAFTSGVDALSTAYYPIIHPQLPGTYGRDKYGWHGDYPNQSASAVGEYVDKTRKIAGANRSVWPTLQAFSWSDDNRERFAQYARFPTLAELRFMAYDSIIHGANGLLFWGTKHIDRNWDFWKTALSVVVKELSTFAPVLVSETRSETLEIEYFESGYSDESAIEYIQKDYRGSRYLIAANRSLYPATVSFSPATLGNVRAVRVEGERRDLSVRDGKFVDTFEPLAVHIFVWPQK